MFLFHIKKIIKEKRVIIIFSNNTRIYYKKNKRLFALRIKFTCYLTSQTFNKEIVNSSFSSLHKEKLDLNMRLKKKI